MKFVIRVTSWWSIWNRQYCDRCAKYLNTTSLSGPWPHEIFWWDGLSHIETTSGFEGYIFHFTPVVHWHCARWRHQIEALRYWPFVRGIHRSPVNFPHKGQWRGALMFSLICSWINGWVNNGEACDLRRHRTHYDVTVMGGYRRSVVYITSKPTAMPNPLLCFIFEIFRYWLGHESERSCYRSNILKISDISLKFGGVIYSTMKPIVFKWPFSVNFWGFEILNDRSQRRRYRSNSFRIFKILAWNLYRIPWNIC